MSHDEPLTAETPLSQLLLHAAHRIRRARVQALEPYGLADHQARAFLVILRWAEHAGELRPSRLAERLRIAPRSVTEVLDALEEKGLIVRHPSPTDRRAMVVEPTAAGLELGRKMHRGELTGTESEIFAALSESEQRTLARLLSRIADH